MLAVLVMVTCSSCSGDSWQRKFGWKAEEYFEDPQVIALCHAIEDREFDEIDRLVADGVEVNTVGKNGMTPLLWAYPGNDLELFEYVLERGADPNVILTGHMGKKVNMRPGDSVMSMCAKTVFPGYLKAVLKHGGNANIQDSWKNSPLHSVVCNGKNKQVRVQALLDSGADIDSLSGSDVTPAMEAISQGGQYELALFLLKKGADPSTRRRSDL
ncbi:MAG: ankyrin repeat domain-containing protein, partial [Planctomycetaceae bacterium]|nr:ankyrin repeat domain-containing protein [Planctomycetaceae bacterium]